MSGNGSESGSTDHKILDQLKKPLVGDLPGDEEQVFRLGLVLNGTVSAGAWTAGVLDSLIEALDAWEAAKADKRDVPTHRVRLEVIGGASGGGVCGAIFARAAAHRFPHAGPQGGTAANPFWRVWVEQLHLDAMLQLNDMASDTTPAASLLDGAAIQAAVDSLLAWPDPASAEQVSPLGSPRPWLASPFHVAVTLTNLRGVPYVMDFRSAHGGARPSWFTDHADHAFFAVETGGAKGYVRPDEFALQAHNLATTAGDWRQFGTFARATGAFPVGFPAVRLSRPTVHYDWRFKVVPGGKRDGEGKDEFPILLKPAWDRLPVDQRPTGHYVFEAVDGGAMNNQPFDLVHDAMAGAQGSLERNKEQSRAAILVVDPFQQPPNLFHEERPPELLRTFGGLMEAWKQQSRLSTSDLLLAMDPAIGSRWLLTAGRSRTAKGHEGKDSWGAAALTASGAGAFLGFVYREFRVHDYLLGRSNAREWMRKHFTLPRHNPLFGAFATSGAAPEYTAPSGEMCIIPLVAEVRAKLPEPPWPNVPEFTRGNAVAARIAGVTKRTGALDGLPCEAVVHREIGKWAGGKVKKLIEQARKDTAARA